MRRQGLMRRQAMCRHNAPSGGNASPRGNALSCNVSSQSLSSGGDALSRGNASSGNVLSQCVFRGDGDYRESVVAMHRQRQCQKSKFPKLWVPCIYLFIYIYIYHIYMYKYIYTGIFTYSCTAYQAHMKVCTANIYSKNVCICKYAYILFCICPNWRSGI